MKVLVTGASGYIGSQTCYYLHHQGHTLVGVDRNMIKHQYCRETYIGDYSDSVMDIMLQDVDCVVHIGATSLVGPSVLDPSKYYNNNVVGALKLLDACNKHGIKRFVFASSAATYGEPNGGVCLETEQHEPMNPYGWSKRMTEIMLSDYATAYEINSVSLRFFNVAGADTLMEMGQEKAATHIIAKLIEMTMDGKEFTLNGGDFNTPDGTCVRDYVHVEDVARGIEKAITFTKNNNGAHIFNLGNKNKKLVVFPGATHSYDKTGSGYVDGSIVSPECRIYTDNNGELWVRPNDPEKWFNITANGGWFGKKGDKKLYSNAMRLCWGYGASLAERNANAYEQTMKIFKDTVEKYLLN